MSDEEKIKQLQLENKYLKNLIDNKIKELKSAADKLSEVIHEFETDCMIEGLQSGDIWPRG